MYNTCVNTLKKPQHNRDTHYNNKNLVKSYLS